MITEIARAARQKEIRTLLARWIKGQRSKQRKLPFSKATTALQHHSDNHLKKVS